MAIITATSTITNPNKISIAGWVRTPQATLDSAGFVSLLECGQLTDGPSSIAIGTDGSISILFYGEHNGYTYTSGVDVNHTMTQNLFVTTPARPSPGDKWHWIGFSADMSGTSSATADGAHTGQYTLDAAPNFYRFAVNDTNYTAAASATNPPYNNPGALPNGTILPSGINWPGDMVWPGWTFALNGFEFGIPSNIADASSNGQAQYADIMLWTGQAIDFSDPVVRQKFFTVGHKKQPKSVPIAAFGQPDYLFAGHGNDFAANQGSHTDVFTKTGTVNDFASPGF